MRYYVMTVVGLALWAGVLTATVYAMSELMQIGQCGYRIGTMCPEGTGQWITIAGVGALVGLIGAGIYGARGEPPGGDDESTAGSLAAQRNVNSTITMIFLPSYFLSLGAGVLLAGLTTDADISAGFYIGFVVPGVIFVAMLVFAATGSRRRRQVRSSAASPYPAISRAYPAAPGASPTGPAAPAAMPTAPATPPPAAAREEDPLVRIEKLAKLRDDGTISSTEFELAKAKILAGGL